ncbi:hypothetical protein CBR_g48358 [Chara braunii]|uniref:Uncharacterized protein n=1 Tax=Chara braunii TaxID=69332 RepID=A0A388K4A7_CHABU|nr:hypothetical protein CBR_g48358 [Chara braunii]|eukprot:GBG64892.1 hypothetical protein CBR_g48358 [Chara braunii]
MAAAATAAAMPMSMATAPAISMAMAMAMPMAMAMTWPLSSLSHLGGRDQHAGSDSDYASGNNDGGEACQV